VDTGGHDAMDVCGTGGDGRDTFNISTLASFVVAGAGQPVAKHGNHGVSSVCGSSDLMAHFGHVFSGDPDEARRSLDRANICFLHAPLFHPAMKNVAPVRRELGVKTFFNMLGPMVNPAFPRKQMTGVYSLELARLYGYLYQRTDKRFSVVHSIDGYDEISLTGPFKLIANEGERILFPEDLGLGTHRPEELHGGDTVEDAARIFLDVLDGGGTAAQREVVIANAGMALHCAGHGGTFGEAIAKARESLDSGAAMRSFKALVDRHAGFQSAVR